VSQAPWMKTTVVGILRAVPTMKAARNPRRDRGPPARWLFRSRRIYFSVLLPSATAQTEAFAVWRQELRFLSPNGLRDHSVHQRERCKSAESRINLLPGTPPRYCGVDETRDWSRHSNSKTISFSNRRDNIGKRIHTRKRALTYPQRCTLLTFPQQHASRHRTQKFSGRSPLSHPRNSPCSQRPYRPQRGLHLAWRVHDSTGQT
jgi:hypothetical protein